MTVDLTRRELMLAGAAALTDCGRVTASAMEGAVDSIQSEVNKVLDRRAAAASARDIDRLMSVYSADIEYFDVVPPLRYIAAATLRERFLGWFDRWSSDIRQETHHLTIVGSGDFAAAYMLVRAGGTLKSGQELDYWVRASCCLRRSDGQWLITHEHVSLPVDLKTGKAVMDLVP